MAWNEGDSGEDYDNWGDFLLRNRHFTQRTFLDEIRNALHLTSDSAVNTLTSKAPSEVYHEEIGIGAAAALDRDHQIMAMALLIRSFLEETRAGLSATPKVRDQILPLARSIYNDFLCRNGGDSFVVQTRLTRALRSAESARHWVELELTPIQRKQIENLAK